MPIKFRLSIVFLFLSFSTLAQIQVVDKELRGISHVQLIQTGHIVLAISDDNGSIAIDVSTLDTARYFLYHEGYHSKAIRKRDLLKNPTVMLRAKTNSFDPIVVYPVRTHFRQGDVALSMESIGKEAIALFQPATSAELLTIKQNVYVQKSQQGGGSPMIRGFGTNRILLVVDGVRMNTAIFRAGNLQNVNSIDPYSIGSTEVIFGPGSQFYGSDAIGGVLHFKTKALDYRDSFYTAAHVATRASSADRQRTVHADLSYGSNRWSAHTSLSVFTFGDLTIGSKGPAAYGQLAYVTRIGSVDTSIGNTNINLLRFKNFNQYNAMQKLGYKVNDSARFTYAFHYATTSNITRFDRMIQYRDGQLANAEWYYGPQQWMMQQMMYENTHSRWWKDQVIVNAAYQSFGESRHDRKYGSNSLQQRYENVSAYNLNIDASKNLKRHTAVNYGAEYVWNTVSSRAQAKDIVTQATEPIATRYPNGSVWWSTGMYLNAVRKWNVRYKTEAGFRLNHTASSGAFNTDYYPLPVDCFVLSNTGVTGALSHLFRLKNGSIGLTTSTAFRSPNIDDVAKVFDSSPGQVILPNSELKPEYAYNGEVNFDYTFFKQLKLSAAAFYTYLDRAIGNSSGSLNGIDSIEYDGVLSEIRTLSNLDYATVHGIQLKLDYAIDSFWNIESHYTLLQSSSSNGDPIRHITPNFGGSVLRFTKHSYNISVVAQYNAEFGFDQFAPSERNDLHLYLTDAEGKPYSPAWMVFHIKSSFSIKDGLRCGVSIENILDKRYRPYRSGVTAAGRNIGISVSYDIK